MAKSVMAFLSRSENDSLANEPLMLWDPTDDRGFKTALSFIDPFIFSGFLSGFWPSLSRLIAVMSAILVCVHQGSDVKDRKPKVSPVFAGLHY